MLLSVLAQLLASSFLSLLRPSPDLANSLYGTVTLSTPQLNTLSTPQLNTLCKQQALVLVKSIVHNNKQRVHTTTNNNTSVAPPHVLRELHAVINQCVT